MLHRNALRGVRQVERAGVGEECQGNNQLASAHSGRGTICRRTTTFMEKTRGSRRDMLMQKLNLFMGEGVALTPSGDLHPVVLDGATDFHIADKWSCRDGETSGCSGGPCV